jgi:hypothetical protein
MHNWRRHPVILMWVRETERLVFLDGQDLKVILIAHSDVPSLDHDD